LIDFGFNLFAAGILFFTYIYYDNDTNILLLYFFKVTIIIFL
jgi:hypothetical protein